MSAVPFFALVRFEPTLFFVWALGLHYNAIGCKFMSNSIFLRSNKDIAFSNVDSARPSWLDAL
jgi:hypothetical protein